MNTEEQIADLRARVDELDRGLSRVRGMFVKVRDERNAADAKVAEEQDEVFRLKSALTIACVEREELRAQLEKVEHEYAILKDAQKNIIERRHHFMHAHDNLVVELNDEREVSGLRSEREELRGKVTQLEYELKSTKEAYDEMHAHALKLEALHTPDKDAQQYELNVRDEKIKNLQANLTNVVKQRDTYLRERDNNADDCKTFQGIIRDTRAKLRDERQVIDGLKAQLASFVNPADEVLTQSWQNVYPYGYSLFLTSRAYADSESTDKRLGVVRRDVYASGKVVGVWEGV